MAADVCKEYHGYETKDKVFEVTGLRIETFQVTAQMMYAK